MRHAGVAINATALTARSKCGIRDTGWWPCNLKRWQIEESALAFLLLGTAEAWFLEVNQNLLPSTLYISWTRKPLYNARISNVCESCTVCNFQGYRCDWPYYPTITRGLKPSGQRLPMHGSCMARSLIRAIDILSIHNLLGNINKDLLRMNDLDYLIKSLDDTCLKNTSSNFEEN